jgi:hypothetical protein
LHFDEAVLSVQIGEPMSPFAVEYKQLYVGVVED